MLVSLFVSYGVCLISHNHKVYSSIKLASRNNNNNITVIVKNSNLNNTIIIIFSILL